MSRPEEATHIRATSFEDSSAREKEGQKINTVVATVGSLPERQEEISYSDVKVIGNGSFGVVYQAKLCNTDQLVAIKKVLQEPQESHHNRELQIMRKLDHCNIIQLLYFFKDEVDLNLVLDFVPETMYGVIQQHRRNEQTVPSLCIKLYMYQLFRSLAYIHANGVCHRDIKPQNILVNPETGELKLCDFGSAKVLVKGERNKSHICSRYYRAPELMFGATDYTVDIDIWSAGCVFAELLLGEPIFHGDSQVDQLVEIIKVLGTPTMEQIRQMNSKYTAWGLDLPQIKPRQWNKVFRTPTPPEAIDLVNHLLEYTPSQRIHPLESCAHPFFDELRRPGAKMPNGREFPTLFNFSEQELSFNPSLHAKLMPATMPGASTPSEAVPQTSSNNHCDSGQPGAKMPNGREFPTLFNFSEQELSFNPSLHAKLMPATMPGASTPSEAVPQTSSNNHCDSGQELSPHKKRMDGPYLISY